MNIIAIIVLTLILAITLILVTCLLFFLKKHRNSVLNHFINDLNTKTHQLQLKKIPDNKIPVSLEEIKEDVYFCTRAVRSDYESPKQVVNENNHDISASLRNWKIKVSYNYKIINLFPSKMVPLNKIDILMTKEYVHFCHSLDSKSFLIKEIENVTVFWEKNKLIKRKELIPGIAFSYEKENYFLLFQTYNEVSKFCVYLNLLK